MPLPKDPNITKIRLEKRSVKYPMKLELINPPRVIKEKNKPTLYAGYPKTINIK